MWRWRSKRIEPKIRSLENVSDEARSGAGDARHEAGQAQSRLGATFEHTDRLRRRVGRQPQFTAELTPPESVPMPEMDGKIRPAIILER